MTTITDRHGNVIREEPDTLEDWRQAAQVEAGLRREFQDKAAKLEEFANWVETWVSQPVGAFSVSALDGIFGMARDKIAVIKPR